MLCEFVDFELFPHADPKCTPTPERPWRPIYLRSKRQTSLVCGSTVTGRLGRSSTIDHNFDRITSQSLQAR